MSSKLDVFDKMNNFLNQEDSDSFIYDLTQDMSGTSNDRASLRQDENGVIELDDFGMSCPVKGKGKKRVPSGEVTGMMDLTDDSYELSPPKKTRRAADGLEVNNLETVSVHSGEGSNDGVGDELNNNASEVKKQEVPDLVKKQEPVTTPRVTKNSRGRRRAPPVPKATKAPFVPKAKKLSLTKALLVTSAVIPELPSYSPVAVSASVPQPSTSRFHRPSAVDLTGDFHMTDKHSSAPLFQKQAVEVVKPIAPTVADDDDDDEDGEACRLNIKINNKIQKFSFRKNQKLIDLYRTIAKQENVPLSSVFLYNGEKRVDIDETPDSAGLTISTILKYGMMELTGTALGTALDTALKQVKKKNQIEFKLQSNQWKRPITVKMSKLDNFKTAIGILCEQVPFKPGQISLSYDGDSVELTDTPTDLELDGGEILDCLVKV